MRSRPLRAAPILAGFGIPAALIGIALAQDRSEGTRLERFLEGMLSTPEQQVTLQGMAGVFTSSPSIARIAVSDAAGVWLEIEGVEVVWARTALLRRVLDIDSISAERVTMLRKPVASERDESGGGGGGPPVDIIVDQFRLPDIILAQAVAGVEANLSADGALRFEDDVMMAQAEVLRLDREGRLTADLQLEPADNLLTANLQFAEPSGGIVADLLGLRGEPAIAFTLAGAGPLADWRADIAMTADEARVLSGAVAVARTDSGYRLSGDLAAALEGIVPAEYAPLVAGDGRLAFDVVRGDDGGYAIDAASLRSQGVDLSASGVLTPDLVPASAEVALTMGAAGRTTLPFVPGGVSVTSLSLNAGLDAGDAAAWRAAMQAAGVESAFGSIGSIALTANGQAENLADPGERGVAFRLEGTADAIALSDPALADAIGPTLRLTAAGGWSAGQPVTFESLQAILTSATANFSGTATAASWDGRFGAAVTDLGRFSAISGRPLAGSAQFQAEGSVTPPGGFDLTLNGDATDLRLGIGALDPLLAGTTRVEGGLARDEAGLRFDDLALSNAALDANVTGSFADPELDLTVAANVADLSSLSDRASGGASLSARVTGATDAPNVEAEIVGDEVTLMGRPLTNAAARFSGIVAGPETSGDAQVSGSLGDVDINGSARLSAAEGGGRALNELLVTIGESRASGNVVIGADGLLDGDLAVVSPDLSQVAPLFLAEASGMVRADIALQAEDGRQSARISGAAADLTYETIAVESADIAGAAEDLFGAPQIEGNFSVRGATAGGLQIASAEGTATRSGEATRFDVNADLADGSAHIVGGITPRGEAMALQLEQFSFARDGINVGLRSPTTIAIADGTARFSATSLSVGSGSVTLAGEAGSALDLTANLADMPAALVNTFAPNLGAEGRVNATITITGTAASPNARFSGNWADASVAASRNAGIGNVTITTEGTLANDIVRLTGRAAGADGLALQVSGSAGVAANVPLDLRIAGAVPLSLGNASLAERGAALQGALRVDIGVRGTASDPQFSGRVTSEGGGFIDPESGIVLSNLSLAAAVTNDRIVVERLTARSGEGTVSGSGSIGLDPGAGFPVDVAIDVRRARYVDGTLVAATFDANLTLQGNFAQGPDLAGSVTIDRAEITVPEQLPRDSVAVDVEHVHTPADVAATVARAEETGRRSGAGSGGGASRGLALDLTINAPRQIFVRGRGLDAEMGGSLRLAGPVSALVADGDFEMRRGRLDVFSQRITFDRGIVTFAGDLDPILDFVGTTQSGEITVTVTVTGNASDPEVIFSSVPELPQDEVLAHLIFERGIGELSPVQIARLADAAAQLSGGGGGLLNSLRASTGLDDLDIVTDAEGGAALAAGRYINENVYLGVQQGVGNQSTRVTIDLDITDDVKARGAVSPQGDSSLGIFFEREY